MLTRDKIFLMISLALLTLSLIFNVTNVLAENSPTPGSSEDPVVTKSYVNFQPLGPLSPGQKIIGEAGTEIILRGGKATAIASYNGGLADVTGPHLMQGANVPLNHLLVISRTDGRGITITAPDTYVLVKGSYQIKLK